MTAPVTGSGKQRIEGVELIPMGFQLCTFYGLADVGIQHYENSSFGPSHKVALAFEFPQHKRIFFEDGDLTVCSVFCNETLSMHKDANLRKKFIQPMSGNPLTDDEAGKFELDSLLGKHFIANIGHSPDGKWANILSIAPLTEQNKAIAGLTSLQVEIINKVHFFALSQGFDSLNYGALPSGVKKKLLKSDQGKAHETSGGKFAEAPKNDTPNAPGQASTNSKLEWLNKSEHSYDDMIAGGWTEESLIEHGYAKLAVTTPSAPPVPVTSAPVPPTPAPAIAPAPAKVEPVLVMNKPDQVAADWIKGGWTEAQIIELGHGKYV